MLIDPQELIATYGYAAVGLVVGLESVGIPLPGETMLVAAAMYAGATHQLSIELVVLAAAAGAIIGDNIGYWVGDKLGFPFLLRHGGRIGLDEPRLKLGQYMFNRHGGKVVFFGRFVAILRVLAAFLAGVNRMPWWRFFAANAAGGVVWATVFGVGGYVFGKGIERFAGPVGMGLLVAGVACAIVAYVLARRHEAALVAEAERAMPGPLRP